jgi:hypothetical protein
MFVNCGPSNLLSGSTPSPLRPPFTAIIFLENDIFAMPSMSLIFLRSPTQHHFNTLALDDFGVWNLDIDNKDFETYPYIQYLLFSCAAVVLAIA